MNNYFKLKNRWPEGVLASGFIFLKFYNIAYIA